MTFIDVSGKTLLNIEGWQAQPLGELISLEYGASLSEVMRVDGEYPVYGSNGQIGKHTTFLVRGPGIIVGRKGTVGAVIWSDSSFWPIDTTYYVNLHKNHDLRWYYWQLLSLPIARMDSSTGVPGLNRNDVYKLWLNVPSPSEQSFIAHILDSLDTQIQQTKQLIAKLKQIKMGLLHDLLTRGIDEHGELRDPVAHPEQFKEAVVGKIKTKLPKEWQIAKLGDIVTTNGGVIQTGPFGSQLHAHEYVSEGIPVIMPQDIQDDHISDNQVARISLAKAEKLARHRADFNDVIFARRGDLSRCASISIKEVGWICGTGCLLIKSPKRVYDSRWLENVYKHDYSQRQILTRAVGSTMVNLNTKLLSNLVIAQPSYNEQIDIVTRIEMHNMRIAAEESYHAKLKQLKKGLMHDLLTGRVRVTQLMAESKQLDVRSKSVFGCEG